MDTAQIAIPPKLIPVFAGDYDVRGSYGGRGSAKTRTFAKMSAVKGYQFAMADVSGIILCGREFMNSLDDSSMEEVKQAIREEPWLDEFYEIGEKYIRSKCRRIEYKFVGLDRNLSSIKSKARILLCWIDEAEPVTEQAYIDLIPTIREEGSELWVTWNPKSRKSATNKRFREIESERHNIVEMNWKDNPMFPGKLDRERLDDLKHRADIYPHVWEGEYESKSNSRVFTNWEIKDFETPDGMTFRLGADWGFAIDPSVLVRCYLEGRRLYIDYEAYMVGCEIDQLPDLFDRVPGSRKWFITADSARPETISYMRNHGFPKINKAIKGAKSIEDGIEFLKSFDIIVHPRCEHVIEELLNYSFKVDKDTNEVLPLLEDKHNHTIDALRYACEGVRKATKPKEKPKREPYVNNHGSTGWMS